MRKTLFVVFSFWFFPSMFERVYGQLPNGVFMDGDSIVASEAGTLNFSLKTQGFNKNNEYFNWITDGYTLFGIQLQPSLNYTLSDNFRFDAGVYLVQDFGNPSFRQILPAITFRAIYHGVNINFGAIDGHLNHGLIEPMYDFERSLTERIEYGTQLLYKGPKLFMDVWVEWETMIYPGDPVQEEIIVGGSFDYKLVKTEGFSLSVPLQGVVYHRGGSIDSSPGALQTVANSALGMVMEKSHISNFLSTLTASFYYAYYRDFMGARLVDYRDGDGLFVNLNGRFGEEVNLMLSYWHGNEFYSVTGGGLYRALSDTYKAPWWVEPRRRLLIFRAFHDLRLTEGVTLTTRIEPYYDFVKKRAELSHGFYINFRIKERVWHKKNLNDL